VNIDKFESNVNYTTKLGDLFEGPLDLLLYLIKQAEIDIKDVFVSDVTDQFLAYINSFEIDMEEESEYLIIAATIIEIKSKACIPNEQVQEEVSNEIGDFVSRLEEYKLYKESAQKLKPLETVDQFYKGPDKSVGDVKIVYSDFNLQGLLDAFTAMLKRVETTEIKNQEREIAKEVFTVKGKIDEIKEIMQDRESVSFFELFPLKASKSEIITTFQALLELIKLQFIKYEQGDSFGDITIIKGEKEDVEVGELDEYN